MAMFRQSLNGQYRMKPVCQTDWMDAVVPGSVYSDLLRQGRMPDPHYRLNEKEVCRLSEQDYEYEREFDAQPELLRCRTVLLRCEGLDTVCEVYLNDQLIGKADNMHRAYVWDVTACLQPHNRLYVRFYSPIKYITDRQEATPLEGPREAIGGIAHLRKAHFMFGWDWGPQLPDMGIWKDIALEGYSDGMLDDVLVLQHHAADRVTLEVRSQLKKLSSAPLCVEVMAESPRGQRWQTVIPAEDDRVTAELTITEPELWWPHTLGAQPLYTVTVRLLAGDAPVDERQLRIGLRTLTVRQEPDEYGRSFAIEVNGVTFFAMGADYIPQDNILSRVTPDKMEKLIRDCVQANMNCLRIWGGGYYPSDEFYDLCDRYGMVVWQDLMYACCIYEMSPSFTDSIAAETRDVMRRLRHHASLGLFCGNNEQEWFWSNDWHKRYPAKYLAQYLFQYEQLLPGIAAEEAPQTFYWRASPSSDGGFDDPNAESMGDMHYWEVWFDHKPLRTYRTLFPRFASEIGFESFPDRKTIESFTEPEDRCYESSVITARQKNESGLHLIPDHIADMFGQPKDFDSLVYLSQVMQIEGMRWAIEHFRRNRGRCMGAIYWQLNDCWPGISWSSVDYFGRWKGLHYAAARFYAPVLLSICDEDRTASIHVCNETTAAFTGVVQWKLATADGAVVCQGQVPVSVPAQTSAAVEMLDLTAQLNEETVCDCFLYAWLTCDGQTVSRATALFTEDKNFHLTDPAVTAAVAEQDDRFVIRLESTALARYVQLSLRQTDGRFEDNFFDLPAGEVRCITVEKDTLSSPLTADEFREQLEICSLYDAL